MGSFGGHALPGSFFIVFGIWFLIQTFRRYYQSKQSGARFTSTMSFPCSFLCGRVRDWPLEAIIKIFLISVAFSIEIYTGFSHGEFRAPGNAQHATMFFFFAMTGVVDILVHYKAHLPPDIDYVTNVIAFVVEGVLFKFHLHGRTLVDVHVHILLLIIIVPTVFSILAEMRFRHNVLSAVCRSYLILLQGTWFWQVGFILYNPSGETWDEDDPDGVMMATLYFTWHCGVNFIIVLLIGSIIAYLYRRQGYHTDEISMKRLIKKGANGQTMVTMNDDSDTEDAEFEKPVKRR